MTEKVASGLGGLLGDVLARSADSLANALDPSLEAVAAEAAAAAVLEEEALLALPLTLNPTSNP